MMSVSKAFHVYIMTNKKRGTLYTGVTSNIVVRVWQHKNKVVEGFTSRYNLTKLAYCEELGDAVQAITREKQIKGWVRSKKIALIESINPHWEDLAEHWYK
jgi:putative endonuclease